MQVDGMNKEQVRKLVEYIIKNLDGSSDGGTYRYLIYEVIGGIDYADGMRMGLLELNNILVDIRESRKVTDAN